jgi:ABC-type polysaccharide/polyol phosphate export permease
VVLNLLTHLFKLNNRNEYISFYSVLLELVAIILSLGIYHFTSLAFESSVDSSLAIYGVNYFEFIVMGEIVLALPLFFLEGAYRKVRQSLMDGVWDTLNYLDINRLKSILFLIFTAMPKEVIRIIVTLSFSYLFFDFNLSFYFIAIILFYVVLTLPIFFALGLVFCSILLKTGRGQAAIGYFLTLMSIGAGGFFPLSVLPEKFVHFLHFFPYTLVLEEARLYLAKGDLYEFSGLLLVFGWCFIIPIGFMTFTKIAKTQTSESIILK